MSTDERPVAAIATPLARSAIAVIRVSGERAIGLLASRFSRAAALTAAAGHTIHHGTIHDRDGRPLDEVLVAVYRRPRSYTGEESAEVFCHGSPAGVRRVFAGLLDAGFAAAEPGEFTRRAFTNGRLDLTRAEAVDEIVGARTASAHALALDRLCGRVEGAVREVRDELVAVMASLAIQLDYPEEETGAVDVDSARLREAGARCRGLAATYARGRLFQDGARVALAGRTNAGKSSLFNELLQRDRSIVSEVHGTTRDYVEALLDVDGVPVLLFDTAGLRDAGERVEEEGIRRSRAVIAAADLVLYVVDAAQGMTDEDVSRLAEVRRTTAAIVVMNKQDLVEDPADATAVRVSARTGAGIDELNAAIVAHLLHAADPHTRDPHDGPPSGARVDLAGQTSVIIDSERQHALLVRAAEAIDRTVASLDDAMPADAVAVDLQDALDAIGEITGEVTSADILDAVFGSFCVGK